MELFNAIFYIIAITLAGLGMAHAYLMQKKWDSLPENIKKIYDRE